MRAYCERLNDILEAIHNIRIRGGSIEIDRPRMESTNARMPVRIRLFVPYSLTVRPSERSLP
jgi:hypothetical protein